jgi:hypothetical protein
MEIARDALGADAFRAEVIRIQAVGSNVKLMLKHSGNGQFLEAELTRERLRELDLTTGEHFCKAQAGSSVYRGFCGSTDQLSNLTRYLMHDSIYDNICQLIGRTPIVRLNRIPKTDLQNCS